MVQVIIILRIALSFLGPEIDPFLVSMTQVQETEECAGQHTLMCVLKKTVSMRCPMKQTTSIR